MSAGKGDKTRGGYTQAYRDNYENIFNKPKLDPVKIFFDFDECLFHTMFSRRLIKESIGGIDDIVFDLGSGRKEEIYRTVIRPGAREVLAYARAAVGTDNVYVLTASIEVYANTINELAKLGFKPEQIYHRKDISNTYNKKKGSPDFKPCIMIDNLSYNDNLDKAYFLRIDSADYRQIDEFTNDRTVDTKFVDTVCNFIDYRIKHYNNIENRN